MSKFKLQLNPKKNKERVVDDDGNVRRVAALCNSEYTGEQVRNQCRRKAIMLKGLFVFSVIVDNKQIIA